MRRSIWSPGRSYVTVTGKAAARRDRRTRYRRPRPVFAAGVLPVRLRASSCISMRCCSTHRSCRPSAPITRLTLEHYRVIFTEGLPAIEDTLIIALIGMPLGGLYGIVIGYLVGRTRIPRPQGDGNHQHAQLCAAGHHRRHRLSAGVQRQAAGADRNGDHPDRLLRLPVQPDRNPHHRSRCCNRSTKAWRRLPQASAPAAC